MHHAVSRIEFGCDQIKVLNITGIVAAIYRIGDVIGQLNDSRCTRIYEKRRVSKTPNYTPSGSESAKVSGHPLQGCFMGTFVENQQTTLTVTLAAKTSKVNIESTTKILKGHFHWVTAWKRWLVDSTRKRSRGIVGVLQDIENCFDYALSLFTGHGAPRFNSTREDFGSVKLDAVRIGRPNTLGETVKCLGDPVGLRLVDGDATKDKIILV